VLKRVVPYASAANLSRGLARAEPDALRDPAEMFVGEPVAMAAELASEGALAELLAPRGSVLVDRARIAQQSRIWSPIAAVAIRSPIGGRADMQASRAVGRGSREPVGGRRARGQYQCRPGPAPCAVAFACWRVIFSTSSPMASPANAAIGLVAAVIRSARMTGRPGWAWMWPMLLARLSGSTFPDAATARARYQELKCFKPPFGDGYDYLAGTEILWLSQFLTPAEARRV